MNRINEHLARVEGILQQAFPKLQIILRSFFKEKITLELEDDSRVSYYHIRTYVVKRSYSVFLRKQQIFEIKIMIESDSVFNPKEIVITSDSPKIIISLITNKKIKFSREKMSEINEWYHNLGYALEAYFHPKDGVDITNIDKKIVLED